MDLKKIYREILEEAKKRKIKDLIRFNNLKLKILKKYKISRIPKNAAIASIASSKDRRLFKEILSMKPTRTISGVAPIALMTDPYPCPHTIKGIGPCSYCPGGPGSEFGFVPQSYTGKEPSTRRAIRNRYDPYFGVFNRLEHYVAMNLVPEKVEIILQGGTFNFFPKAYQEYFVKYTYKAMNDFSLLFYDKGNLDLEKFNIFFEMPCNVEDKERTLRIQRRLLFIKNLDLNNKKILAVVNELFFNKKNFGLFNNENSKKGKKFIGILKDNEIFKKIKDKKIKKLLLLQWERLARQEQGYGEETVKIDTILKKTIGKNALLNDEIIDNDIKNLKKTIKLNKKLLKNSQKNISDANLIAIKGIIDKVNEEDNKSFSLEKIQKQNEKAKIRCVGLTIETRSDFGKLEQGNEILRLGCTRVEIGVQSVYDDVLEKTNRGNTVRDNIQSIRILKDLGLKINLHYMPGMPHTSMQMDMEGLRELFLNPDYRPDMLKIYPCMVMKGTRLYEDYKKGKFKPLRTKEAAELIAWFKQFVSPYCRIMRIQRDIPSYLSDGGVDKTNLRQYVEKEMKRRKIKCSCIRCREIGHKLHLNKDLKINKPQVIVYEYKASEGMEFFISYEDISSNTLFGYCRLRVPSQLLRKEITKRSALLRELHVLGSAVSLGKKGKIQHRGIGRKLVRKAEEIAKDNDLNKVVVISAIGARDYFRKLGYKREGPYMVKHILAKGCNL